MSNSQSSHTPANRLLALLPPDDYLRLTPHLQAVSLPRNRVIYHARSPIDYVYFPSNCTLSAMTRMEDGAAIEVATIGNEGMTGLTAFLGGDSSPTEVLVQFAGYGLRMSADALRTECWRDGPLRRLLVRYTTAYATQISYSVACNGLHKLHQRCSRWLLTTADRIGSDVLPITHEFLSIMLGVRRSSVTEVLLPLQERGLIQNNRAKIMIVDRPGLAAMSCECYRVVKDEFVRQFG